MSTIVHVVYITLPESESISIVYRMMLEWASVYLLAKGNRERIWCLNSDRLHSVYIAGHASADVATSIHIYAYIVYTYAYIEILYPPPYSSYY